MRKVPITRSGYRWLLQELRRLRRVVRPEVLDDLREARGYGIKMDNQQYLSARERQVSLEKRINDIEEKLARCEIVVGRKFFFRQVGFGTVITIQNLDTGEISRYEMVGPWESNISDGKLSVESPVGSCMLGHREGDVVPVVTPAGARTYQILSIEI